MEFEKLIESFNDITISSEEMAEYEDEILIDEDKLVRLSEKFRAKLRGGFIRKQRIEVERELLEGEKIEVYIDGKDITALDRSVSLTAVPGMFLTSHDYAVFYSIFITNKRIFVGYANYYNQILLSKIYDYKEVEQIIFDSSEFNRESGDIDRSYRIYAKVMKSFYYFTGSLVPLYLAWWGTESTLVRLGVPKNTFTILILTLILVVIESKLVIKGFKKIFALKNLIKVRFRDCNEVTLLIHNESDSIKILGKLREIARIIK